MYIFGDIQMALKPYREDHIVVPRFCEANGFYTTPERSAMMKRIKAKNSKIEVKFRRALWNIGLRYRKNVRSLPGIPDIVFRKYRLVIFIDGAFWHGYEWEKRRDQIQSNREFWIAKIERNIQHDREVNQQLSDLGWHVERFWEHEIKKEFHVCVGRVLNYIKEYENRNI
ncbi:MAG: very short patch repair endonuclease [Bacteroidales bacterium]